MDIFFCYSITVTTVQVFILTYILVFVSMFYVPISALASDDRRFALHFDTICFCSILDGEISQNLVSVEVV